MILSPFSQPVVARLIPFFQPLLLRVNAAASFCGRWHKHSKCPANQPPAAPRSRGGMRLPIDPVEEGMAPGGLGVGPCLGFPPPGESFPCPVLYTQVHVYKLKSIHSGDSALKIK